MRRWPAQGTALSQFCFGSRGRRFESARPDASFLERRFGAEVFPYGRFQRFAWGYERGDFRHPRGGSASPAGVSQPLTPVPFSGLGHGSGG